MAPVKVFVAYVDTYIGEHLLQQFTNKPTLFHVYGCTWEEVAAEALTIRSLEQQQYHTGIGVGSFGQLPGVGSGQKGGNSFFENAVSQVERESVASNVDSAMTPELDDLAATHSPKGNGSNTCRGPLFFWHRNTTLMRKVLLQSDWIIMELRQSQDAFDMLSFLQQTAFEKPKKLVLLSSFMTWFATPPLSYPEVEEGEEMDADAEEEEDMEDIQSPYPPPPEDKPEKVYTRPDQDEDIDEEEEEMPEGKEVLTEDQYNRRIPHVKYFNWRDAEKAVAAAHHAKGLPLDTYVVFAGLPYGDGESLLEPFFRQAWSTEANYLPIYGNGTQCVPMIHVRDLATFTRKLLRCPADELPNPQVRYFFATDGASNSWRDVMETINRMFGQRMTLKEVPAEEFPLHNHVEHFTIDLRVDNSSIQAIMEMEDQSGKEEGMTDGPVLHHDSNGMRNTWIANGGIKKNSLKIALEFRHHRNVTPLRLALLGPPLVGKTYLSEKLAEYYKLPRFSIEEVVVAFKAEVTNMQQELVTFREEMIEKEKQRRLEIKKRRILFATRSRNEREVEGNSDSGEDDPRGGGEDRNMGSKGRKNKMEEASEDDVEEREEQDFALTEEEEQEAEELMEERFQNSPRTNYLRQEIGRFERILLMRVRPRPPTPDANPKKRANLTKKKLTKEQQRKKEEDELQQAKEALKDAPFQDRALALMMRWRLDKPDCRCQGYILDGFPTTVELARLCFRSEELLAPETEEDALNPPPEPSSQEGNEDGQDPEDARSSELSDEWRLPDHIIFLQAEENYLLDRLTAICQQQPGESGATTTTNHHYGGIHEGGNRPLSTEGLFSEGGIDTSVMNISENAEDARALERFHESMDVFRQQLFESSYSLFNYFECAVSVAGNTTVGGRHPVTHVISVQETEPLIPPPLPVSEFELPIESDANLAIRAILGPVHHFGKAPLEIHEEEVRLRCLEEEKRLLSMKNESDIRSNEQQAFLAESESRSKQEQQLLEIKRADYVELEKRKAPLREYLLANVIPLVSKGLLEVCAIRPEDPVDYLAEWLLRHNPHDDIFSEL